MSVEAFRGGWRISCDADDCRSYEIASKGNQPIRNWVKSGDGNYCWSCAISGQVPFGEWSEYAGPEVTA